MIYSEIRVNLNLPKDWIDYSEEERAEIILSNEYFLKEGRMSSLNSALKFKTGIDFIETIRSIVEDDIEVTSHIVKSFLLKNYPGLSKAAQGSFEERAAKIFLKWGLSKSSNSGCKVNPHLENKTMFFTKKEIKIFPSI